MLSLTGKRWIAPRKYDAINASHVLASIASERTLGDKNTPYCTPAAYSDIKHACDRIRQAVERQEKIALFGDYDCDGVTAIAQLTRFFRRHNNEPLVRLPHRVCDGYGLKKHIVDEFVDHNITLLITADTGIASVAEIAELKRHGIDVIVTDHHSMQDELPDAFALIHPALSSLPEPHPSGSGVAYALIAALEKGQWEGQEEDVALAMLGTVADLVELRGQNRALVQKGMAALENLSSGPLCTLREHCRPKNAPFTSTDIAFRIVPRINAAGRIDDPEIALRALLEGGESTTALDQLNEHRQALTRELFSDVLESLDRKNLPALITGINPDYPHGIVGLLAGKLTEKFGRPTLIAHTDGVRCTASLRSIPSYNITEALSRHAKFLESFGGHSQAAGCTFALKNAEQLIAALNNDVAHHVPDDMLHPTVQIDATLHPSDVQLDLCQQISQLEPFGQGNNEPRFLLENVAVQHARTCGADDSHLQCSFGGTKAIGFGMGQFVLLTSADVVVRVSINEWNGKKSPQCIIEDIAEAGMARKMLETSNVGIATA